MLAPFEARSPCSRMRCLRNPGRSGTAARQSSVVEDPGDCGKDDEREEDAQPPEDIGAHPRHPPCGTVTARRQQALDHQTNGGESHGYERARVRPRGAPTCAARSARRIHHSAPPEEPRALLVRRADAGTANECGSPGPGRGKRPNACAPRLRRRSRPIPTRSCGAARSGCESTVWNRSDLERSSSRSGASARKR